MALLRRPGSSWLLRKQTYPSEGHIIIIIIIIIIIKMLSSS